MSNNLMAVSNTSDNSTIRLPNQSSENRQCHQSGNTQCTQHIEEKNSGENTHSELDCESAKDICVPNTNKPTRHQSAQKTSMKSYQYNLEGQVKNSRMLLVQAHQELQLKNKQIQGLADENASLLHRVKKEKEIQTRLQQQVRVSGEEVDEIRVQKLEGNDQELIENNSLHDLNKEVKRARDELQDVYFENSRYRSEVQRLNSVIQQTNHSHNNAHGAWREQATQLLTQLQKEENRARTAAQEAEQLGIDVIKLGDENMKLDQQLSTQEHKIGIMLDEMSKRKQELSDVKKENQDLAIQTVEAKNYGENASDALKKSKEELRMMAEKVFHLLKQLKRMDEWKEKAQEDMKSAAKKIFALEKRGDAIQKVLDRDSKIRSKLEQRINEEKHKTTSFRLTAQEFRRKFVKEERIRRKLMEALKLKERSHADTLNKYRTAQSNLRSHIRGKDSRQHRINTLEKKVRDLISTTKTLHKNIKGCDQTHSNMKNTIRLREAALKECKHRERKLLKQVSHLQKERNIKAAVRASNDSYEDVRFKGQQLKSMLTSLKMSKSTFEDLANTPNTLLQRLAQRFCNQQSESEGVARFRTGVRHTLRRPQQNVSDLIDAKKRLKTCMFGSITRLLIPETYSRRQIVEPSQIEEHKEEHLKYEQGDAVPDKLRSRFFNAVRCLDLSHCDIGEYEIQVIADILPQSPTLVVLDLSHNDIYDDGFLLLSRAIAQESSSIELVSFANNYISISAIKSLVISLRQHKSISSTYLRYDIIPLDKPHRMERRIRAELVIQNDSRTILVDVRRNDMTHVGLQNVSALLQSEAQSTTSDETIALIEQRVKEITSLYKPFCHGIKPPIKDESDDENTRDKVDQIIDHAEKTKTQNSRKQNHDWKNEKKKRFEIGLKFDEKPKLRDGLDVYRRRRNFSKSTYSSLLSTSSTRGLERRYIKRSSSTVSHFATPILKRTELKRKSGHTSSCISSCTRTNIELPDANRCGHPMTQSKSTASLRKVKPRVPKVINES